MSEPRRSVRTTSRALLAALALVAAIPAVSAQPERATPAPRVAVFPFTAPGELTQRMVGRRASAAAHAALAQSGPWEIVEPAWLLRLCEAENARAPFAVGYLQMLGQRARAPLAITGSVENCQVNPDRGTAQVTVAIDLVETLNGARLASSRGVASAKRADAEVLGQAVDRALTEAAADAVREITSFDPLAAMVVTTLPDGRVMLDGPQEPRIKPGAKLLVFRNSEPVGSLEVKTSKLTVLHARPLAGEDFRQGDRAVVVAR